MNGIIRILWVVGVVVPLMCATVSAETREERKLRIERKYLFEQQGVVQLNLEPPEDPDEDPLGRDPDYKVSSNESLASGSGMVRRPSGAPVRRATGFEETEEEGGLFGETSGGDGTAADLRRQKLDDNWQRLMNAQRTRSTERSPSSGSGGLSPYSSGASSGSANSSGYSSFSQPQPASPSALGSLGSMNSLASPMGGTSASSPGATRTTTPGLSSSSSSAWSTSSGSSSAPSGVSPIRSTMPRTTTPSSTPSTGSGFRGTDGASLLDI